MLLLLRPSPAMACNRISLFSWMLYTMSIHLAAAGGLRGARETPSCAAFMDDLASKMAAMHPNPDWRSAAGKAAAKALLANGTMDPKPEDPNTFIYGLVQPANSSAFEGMFWEFRRDFPLLQNLVSVTTDVCRYTDFETQFGKIAGILAPTPNASDDISLGACGVGAFIKFWDSFSEAFTRVTMEKHRSRYLKNGTWLKNVTALISVPIHNTSNDPDGLEQSYFLRTEVKAMREWSAEMKIAEPPIQLLNVRDNCDAVKQEFTKYYPSLVIECQTCGLAIAGYDWASCAAAAKVQCTSSNLVV